MQRHRRLDVYKTDDVYKWLSQVEPFDALDHGESHGPPQQEQHCSGLQTIESDPNAPRQDLRVEDHQELTVTSRNERRERAARSAANHSIEGAVNFPAHFPPISHPQEQIGPRVTGLCGGKTYERKPRHKTRPDRYEPKVPLRVPAAVGGGNGRSRLRKRKRNEVTKPEDAFRAPNVLQERLTLSCNFDKALFRRGRTSIPMRRRDLPDLTFSEMNFLSRDSSHQSEAKLASYATGQKPVQDTASFTEASPYFLWGQPNSIGPNQAAACPSDGARVGSLSIPSPGKQRRELLVQSRGDGRSVSTSKNLPKMTNASASYYTWSESTPRRVKRQVLSHRTSDAIAPNLPLDLANSANLQSDHTKIPAKFRLLKQQPEDEEYMLLRRANRLSSNGSGQGVVRGGGYSRMHESNESPMSTAPPETNSIQRKHDTPDNLHVLHRKAAATRTSLGPLLRQLKTSPSDAETLAQQEKPSAKGLTEHDMPDRHQLWRERMGFQNTGFLPWIHKQASHRTDKQATVADEDLTIHRPARISTRAASVAPQEVCTKRLFQSIEVQHDEVPLVTQQRWPGTYPCGPPQDDMDFAPVHPSTFKLTLLPAIQGLQSGLDPEARAMADFGMNLRAIPEPRISSAPYGGETIPADFDSIPSYEGHCRGACAPEQIEVPTSQYERSPSLGFPEAAKSAEDVTPVPDPPPFWRPNKLY
ncbi:hypothetical protein VTO42DRAFT_3474 [Malbranchea cinnamomea]